MPMCALPKLDRRLERITRCIGRAYGVGDRSGVNLAVRRHSLVRPLVVSRRRRAAVVGRPRLAWDVRKDAAGRTGFDPGVNASSSLRCALVRSAAVVGEPPALRAARIIVSKGPLS